MLSDPLVHIGVHKTASTSLQPELFHFDSAFFCPLSRDRNPNSGKFIGKHFVRDRERYLLSSFEMNSGVVQEQVEAVLGEIDSGNRVPVISYERLSGNPHAGGFDARTIADRIRAVFPEARIFCVIREQKDMILSTYFQYLKIGGTDSVRDYLTRSYDGRRPGFSPAAFNYLDLVAYYRDIFPPDKVLVLPYEMLRDGADGFLRLLGDFTGTDLAELSARATVSHNPRKDDSLVPRFPPLNLFRRKSSVNGYSPMCTAAGKFVLKGVDSLIPINNRKQVLRVKRQVEAIIGDRYASANRALSDLIGIELSNYGYYRH
jgi:hypothetical protein